MKPRNVLYAAVTALITLATVTIAVTPDGSYVVVSQQHVAIIATGMVGHPKIDAVQTTLTPATPESLREGTTRTRGPNSCANSNNYAWLNITDYTQGDSRSILCYAP
jgi:hypothetical protein